jgi:hypothetical protein
LTAGPLPAQLSLARIIAQRGRPGWAPWLMAASVVLALRVGVGAGWWLHGVPEPGRTEQAMVLLGQEARISHVVYAVDVRLPIEVPGAEMPHPRQLASAVPTLPGRAMGVNSHSSYPPCVKRTSGEQVLSTSTRTLPPDSRVAHDDLAERERS